MKKQNKLPSILLILFIVGFTAIIAGLSDLGERLKPSETAKLEAPEIEVASVEPQSGIELPINTLEPQNIEPEILGKIIKIKSGDTLAKVLENEGVDRVEVAYVVGEISDVFDLRKLRAGQEVNLNLEELEGQSRVKSIKFQPSIDELVQLVINDKNEFVATAEEIPLEKVYIKASGEIDSSFYQSLTTAGVTDNVTLQLIAAMSFVVDFQREIQPGDKFEVLYQAYKNAQGELIKGRRPVYAKMQLAKAKDFEMYVIEEKDKSLSYYHPDGASLKKGLLRTPINGARLSSHFGMRKHPVLGYSKLHKGTDFAAPRGTPIYAAGDGTIVELGRKGGYGNYVRIKHNGTYQTAYAHAKSFARGMKKGKKVKQGQVVAYVGSTGRSTGPHLHYEVLKHGKQINPQKAKFPIVKKLKGKALQAFKQEVGGIQTALENAPTKSQFAQAE